MSDNKITTSQNDYEAETPVTQVAFYTVIDNLYKKVVSDVHTRLQDLKAELKNELNYTSAQINAYCEIAQRDSAVMAEKNLMAVDGISNELKYGYQQNQMIHEDLVHLVSEDLMEKIDAMDAKLEALKEIENMISAIDCPADAIKEKLEEVSASTAEQADRVISEIQSLQLPESVDYDLLAEKVSEKVIEMLCEDNLDEEETEEAVEEIEEDVEEAEFDIDELVNRVAEKVVESLYAPEKVDYKQIEELVQASALDADVLADTVADKVLEKTPAIEIETIDYDRIAEVVAERMPVPEGIDYERLAETVLAKLPAPVEPAPIDYEALSDMIVSKMPKPVEPAPIDYETLAEMVTAKMLAAAEEKEAPSYDVILDDDGVSTIANGVFERLDVDAIAEKVAAKMPVAEKEELNYELLADMVADRLAVKVEILSEPVEEATEEVVEEATEEVVEEVVAEEPAQEEVAATVYESEDGELINAETGLVVRLKRSFAAKLKQSDESVKVFYDQIKNELVSYKKVKSTVSWHGDRFNLGRATVAKMNICGKTLCFYIALDPADPELKETIYHQKNVGDQKAYQATPFKVKVKSDMGAKRAVRLVNILAEKLGATKTADFVPTDYVEEYAYETTQELLEKGLIKETQEKKIDFEF